MRKKIVIINGPNLNLLGLREPQIYGTESFEEYFLKLKERYYNQAELIYIQSNHEGTLIDTLQNYGYEQCGLILNAGGYTHTSIALADCISAIQAPVIEVHISDIKKRESFRHHSYLEAVCHQSIMGHGLEGYAMAIEVLLPIL